MREPLYATTPLSRHKHTNVPFLEDRSDPSTALGISETDCLFPRIDLRALQPVREIDVARISIGCRSRLLPGRLRDVRCRLLCAAERQMDFRADRRSIHVSNAGVNVAHGAERLVDVARVHRRRETIRHAIRDLDCFVEVIHWDQAEHRPEDLFLGDAHLRIHVTEDGRLEEPAISVVGRVQRLAAGFQFRAFILADLDVLRRWSPSAAR